MLSKNLLSVKLFIVNSRFYNSGNLVGDWIELPMEDGILRERVNEIQNGDDNYIVLQANAQFKCTVENDLDVFNLNKKLKMLTDSDVNILKAVSEYEILPLIRIVDIVLNKKYVIYDNVMGEEQLGYKLYREQQLPFNIPDYLSKYIDFKAIGHEACMKESIHIIPEMHIAERILLIN